MRRNLPVFLLLPGLCLLLAATRLAAQDAAAAADFENQIRPLLLNRCGQCHGPRQQKGGLRLDARSHFFRGGDSGPVIVAGKSKESPLIERVSSTVADLQMPPAGPRLTAAEIELLQTWINLGANWPESDYDRQALIDPRTQHWSFQPLPASVTPPPAQQFPQYADIDRFLLAQLKPLGLSMNPAADRRTL
ncbi:MAG: c-type cytochrome domain-containing protein, partial [Planctomycetaceae bacterium]